MKKFLYYFLPPLLTIRASLLPFIISPRIYFFENRGMWRDIYGVLFIFCRSCMGKEVGHVRGAYNKSKEDVEQGVVDVAQYLQTDVI